MAYLLFTLLALIVPGKDSYGSDEEQQLLYNDKVMMLDKFRDEAGRDISGTAGRADSVKEHTKSQYDMSKAYQRTVEKLKKLNPMTIESLQRQLEGMEHEDLAAWNAQRARWFPDQMKTVGVAADGIKANQTAFKKAYSRMEEYAEKQFEHYRKDIQEQSDFVRKAYNTAEATEAARKKEAEIAWKE